MPFMSLGSKSRKIVPEVIISSDETEQPSGPSFTDTMSTKELSPFATTSLRLSAEFGQNQSQSSPSYTRHILSDFDDLGAPIATEILRYALAQTKSKGFSFPWTKKTLKEAPKQVKEYPVVENIEVREDVKQVHESLKHNEPILINKQNLNIFLFYAARFGDMKALKDICATGANVNIQDDKGKTPMAYAAIGNHPSCLSSLKHNGAIIDVPDSCGRTALHWASFYGNSDAVKSLLNYNASTMTKDNTGKTALHLSAMSENSDALHIVIRNSLNGALNNLDDEGMTPVMWAAYLGNESCVQLLLSYDVTLTVKGKNGMNAFHFLYNARNTRCCSMMIRYQSSIIATKDSMGRTLLHLAAAEGNITLLQYLLEIGCNINEADSKSRLALHWAAVNGHSACVTLLSAKSIDLDIKDIDGATPLHYASMQGHFDCAMILIKRGADVDMLDNKGETCLMWAAKQNRIDMVKMLMSYEADYTNQDYQGSSVLHLFSQTGSLEGTSLLLRKDVNVDVENDKKETPLIVAIKFGRLDICNALVHDGASVNTADIDGKTPLHHAITKNQQDIVKLILNSGAMLEVSDKQQRTPLHEALHVGNVVSVELLLRYGANTNHLDILKGTTLHIAAKKGLFECCRALILANAKINLIDDDKKTALDYASEEGHPDCKMLLEMCGGLTRKKLERYSVLILERFYEIVKAKKQIQRAKSPVALESIQESNDSSAKTEISLPIAEQPPLVEKSSMEINQQQVTALLQEVHELKADSTQELSNEIQQSLHTQQNTIGALIAKTGNSSSIVFDSHDSLCHQLAESQTKQNSETLKEATQFAAPEDVVAKGSAVPIDRQQLDAVEMLNQVQETQQVHLDSKVEEMVKNSDSAHGSRPQINADSHQQRATNLNIESILDDDALEAIARNIAAKKSGKSEVSGFSLEDEKSQPIQELKVKETTVEQVDQSILSQGEPVIVSESNKSQVDEGNPLETNAQDSMEQPENISSIPKENPSSKLDIAEGSSESNESTYSRTENTDIQNTISSEVTFTQDSPINPIITASEVPKHHTSTNLTSTSEASVHATEAITVIPPIHDFPIESNMIQNNDNEPQTTAEYFSGPQQNSRRTSVGRPASRLHSREYSIDSFKQSKDKISGQILLAQQSNIKDQHPSKQTDRISFHTLDRPGSSMSRSKNSE